MAMATDELSLLERVFLRIGTAESDEQLQSAVSKFLPPVLLKLSSQQDGVRKKVMELLIHINKRIKSRPLVQLPVEALLLQYQDPAASSFVINFTIIYIKMGYPRLPVDKQAELLPCLLNALEGKPQIHQDSLMLILMPVLSHITLPKDPEKRSSMFGLNERPHLAKQLADFMLDVLLLPYGALHRLEQQQAAPAHGNATSSMPVPPGMSEYSFKRVLGETPMKPDELEQTKLGIVKFVSCGVYPEENILCHLIVAAADTRFNVANAADVQIRKIVGVLDWSNVSMTGPLYTLFLGTQLLVPKNRTNTVKPEHRRQPASTRIRLKILPHLCRARGPAVVFPACIQVFFDSLYGANVNQRLRAMALQFSLLIIQTSNIARLTPVAGVLLSGLLKLIAEADSSLKSVAYVAAGKLGSRVPHLVNKDLALLQTFFEALTQEEQETRMSVREALLSMVDAFRINPFEENDMNQDSSTPAEGKSNGSSKTSAKDTTTTDGKSSGSSETKSENESVDPIERSITMQALLASYIESPEPMARFVAVRYTATVFIPIHVPSRYLLLLACGDSKEEISSEASRSLYDAKTQHDATCEEKNCQKVFVPPFKYIAHFLAEKANARMQDSDSRQTVGNHVLPFLPSTHVEILKYLRLCLTSSAKVSSSSVENLQFPTEYTPLIGRYLTELCSSQEGREAVDKYLSLIQQLLVAVPSIIPASCLLEVMGSVPSVIAENYVQRLPWLKNMISTPKEDMREILAQVYGIVVAHGVKDNSTFEGSIRELMSSMKTKNIEQLHGSVLALAYVLEKKVTILKKTGEVESLTSTPLFKDAVCAIVNQLSHQHTLVISAASSAVGSIGRCTPLPFKEGSAKPPEIGKLDVVKKLQEIASNPKLNSKVKERAVLSTGLLCVGDVFPHSREVIQYFLDVAKESRDIDIHLVMGEAIVHAIQGTRSPLSRDSWTIPESEYIPPDSPAASEDDKNLEWLLEQLLDTFVPTPHPASRQASCVWLLALVKHCSDRAPVKQRLELIQKAFMDLLSENSDIVQDVASKGLGLVYERSDELSQSKLVDELIQQLTSGRRSVQQVSGETKLFEEGQLGKAPTGGNLSTYKELCSLASDLNQPDLIYKFMHLANHNAIWNSKKGAAFGFSTIASKAGEQLSEHLPKIIPRLYRYRFDPTPKIQNSMLSIWHALVSETQKTVDLYHKEILADLLENLTSSQWRVRISCCAALSDFIRGSANRCLHDSREQLPTLWTQLFRVMDDVHENTRHAAISTARDLSKLCVKCCDSSNGKAGEEMVDTILPVIVNNGITSSVLEVRTVSLQTVSQLVGVAGSLLRPQLVLLIPALLEATGELETKKLNQLSVQFSGEHKAQEMIDSVRASLAKSHFTMETVTQCIQYIDGDVLDDLVPKLFELLRNSVGLGTRVAAAHFIVLLIQHLKEGLEPYTGKLIPVLVHGLFDRNQAIRKNYAVTIGHVVHLCREAHQRKLFMTLYNWYFDDREFLHHSAVHTLHAIAHHNQEVLKENADIVAHLAFFAMHANKTEDNNFVEMWEEIWQEVSPGTDSGIRQNLTEICKLLKTALESQSWTMKAQAASAASTVATRMGSELPAENRGELINILLTGLSGRTWTGKETLLQAIATICTSCKAAIKQENNTVVEQIVNAVLKECRKEQIVYKRHALCALGNILSALEVDRFDEVYTIVQDTLTKDSTSKERDEDEEESSKSNERIQLTETVYETLGKAWPNNAQTQERHQEQLLDQCVSCMANSTRSVQVAVITALYQYVDKLCLLDGSDKDSENETLDRILEKLYQALIYALGISKNMRLRKEALNVLFLIAKKLKDTDRINHLQNLTNKFEKTLEDIGKDNTPEVKSRLSDIKELLKS